MAKTATHTHTHAYSFCIISLTKNARKTHGNTHGNFAFLSFNGSVFLADEKNLFFTGNFLWIFCWLCRLLEFYNRVIFMSLSAHRQEETARPKLAVALTYLTEETILAQLLFDFAVRFDFSSHRIDHGDYRPDKRILGMNKKNPMT